MDSNQIVTEAKQKFSGAVNHFNDELKKLRTGRAHPSMVESLTVMAYGQPMPMIQVASIATPEPQLLQITPFDPGTMQAIASAIRDDQSLGLNPVDDGRVIRIQIPALTTERRQQIVKQLNEKAEEALIAMRQARHDAIKAGDQAKKDKIMSEDEHNRFEKQIEELMNAQKQEIEKQTKAKEQEIMTV